MASHSTTIATPIINKASFKDMLAEEANYTPGCQLRHVKFEDTIEGDLTSTPCNLLEEVALPPRPMLQSHPDEIGLHMAIHKFRKMWELKISKLKGGYTSLAGLVFQYWMKYIHVHEQDRRLTQIQAIHLVKDSPWNMPKMSWSSILAW